MSNISLFILVAIILDLNSAQIVFPGQRIGDQLCTTNSQQPGTCKSLPECLVIYTQLNELQQQPCRLPNQLFGVCCPNSASSQTSGVSAVGTLLFRPPNVKIPDLKPQDFIRAAQAAQKVVQQRFQLEEQLFVQRIVIRPGSPAAWHLEFFRTSPQTLAIGNNAIKALEASIQLVAQNNLNPDQGRFALPSFSASSTPQLTETCTPSTPCGSTSQFRTIDGSCNNLRQSDWGKAGTALQRIIPPKYGDGVNSPRLGENSQLLPSARLVSQSLTLTSSSSNQSPSLSLVFMQWGQFIDHDLTHSPIVRGRNASGITCCQNGQLIDQSLRHPDCFPIIIPDNDVFYGKFNQHCMEFVRSLPAVRPQCTFGPREQINQVTSFLDGSAVYGSSESEASGLREFAGGRLLTQKTSTGSNLLPVKADECSDFRTQRFCFKAGDGRVNEQPQLAAMHTIWVREHNRVASILENLNPHWNDERIYQEARRIIGSEIQHITYNEFLPLLLGDTYMNAFQLKPQPAGSGFTNLYDPNINPTITNEFSAAAFRMGHSLVQGIIEGFSSFGGQTRSLLLHQHQFRPFELYEPDGMDSLIRGLVFQPSQNLDRSFTDELKNRLFQTESGFGMDLIALNIQRGRDHGIPPYNDYRELCGRSRARRWEDFLDLLDTNVVEGMRRIYASIDDVDLYIGAISERPVEGSPLGPTFLCLIGDQMARLRRGDRYFYEETNQQSSFTLDQLNSIRSVTLARILCDNSDDLKSVQSRAFIRSDIRNRRVPCNGPDIPSLNLNLWREGGLVQTAIRN